MTLRQKIQGMSMYELETLYNEAVILDNTGILPMDSPLRILTEEHFEKPHVLEMTMISYGVYKRLADLFMLER